MYPICYFFLELPKMMHTMSSFYIILKGHIVHGEREFSNVKI